MQELNWIHLKMLNFQNKYNKFLCWLVLSLEIWKQSSGFRYEAALKGGGNQLWDT